MKMQKKQAVLAAAILSLMLTGCQPAAVIYKPEQSGVFLKKDGTVVSAEIESFDNSGFTEERYKADELQTFVEETVTEYNQEKVGIEGAYAKDAEGLVVSIDSLTVEENTAKLIMNYSSCDEYLGFNSGNPSIEELAWYVAPDAASAGVDVSGFVDTNGKSVDAFSMVTSDKYRVVTVTGNAEVVVEGEIKALTRGVKVKNKNTVVINGEQAVILFK